jgi:hypothetical protein
MTCMRRRRRPLSSSSSPAIVLDLDEFVTSTQYADQTAFLASHWGAALDSYYTDAVTAGTLAYVLSAQGLTATLTPTHPYHNDYIALQLSIADYSGPLQLRLRGRMTRIPPVGDPDEGFDHEDPLLEIDVINPSIDYNGFYNETIREAHTGFPLKFATVDYDPAGASHIGYHDVVPDFFGQLADFVVIIEPDVATTRVRHFYGVVGGPLVKVADVVEPFIIPVNYLRWLGITSQGTGHTTIERVSYYQGPVADNPFGVVLS